MKKNYKFMYWYLTLLLIIFLLIKFISSSSEVDITPGVVDMSGKTADGSGSTDREKWKQDRATPSKWSLYDKSLTSELTVGELAQNPNEARTLWNSNKLSEQQKNAVIQKNYGVNIRDLERSSIVTQDGKEVLVMKNQVSVPLSSLKGTNFNVDIDPINPDYVRISDSSGKFKYLTNQGELRGPSGVSPEDASFLPAGGPSDSPSFGSTPSVGGSEGGFNGALSIMQNLMGLVQNLLGSVKELLTSNAKGKSTVTALSDETKITLEEGAEMSVKSMNEKDVEGKNKEIRLSQTDTSKKAEFVYDSKLNGELKGNNIFVIPKIAAVITEPDTPETKVIHNMAELGGPGPITGAVIQEIGSNQYVKIIKHDIDMKGEKYKVYLFKPFNYLDVECFDVIIKNGDTLIFFQNEKMYYPRYLGNNTPYYINTIKNEKDIDNIFRLLPGGSKGSYLFDEKKIVTVGDMIVEYPEEKGLIMSKSRTKMWDVLR